MDPFVPARWLAHPHLQTLWPHLLRRPRVPPLRAERLELPDGDFVDLAWVDGPADAPIVCLFHGLEGSARSSYVGGLFGALAAEGCRAVLMHFRGCSGVPNRKARRYHSGDTDDIRFLVSTLRSRHPGGAIGAVGVSLGGNALLKYLAEEGEGSPVRAAVAVSPSLEPGRANAQLSRGFSRVYQAHLLGKLKGHLRARADEAAAAGVDVARGLGAPDFWTFDDAVTAPLHGFAGADDYYTRAASRPRLREIATPTLLLLDPTDPFFGPGMVPSPEELSPAVTLERCEGAGHVGFVAGPWRPRYWLDERVPAFLVPRLA